MGSSVESYIPDCRCRNLFAAVSSRDCHFVPQSKNIRLEKSVSLDWSTVSASWWTGILTMVPSDSCPGFPRDRLQALHDPCAGWIIMENGWMFQPKCSVVAWYCFGLICFQTCHYSNIYKGKNKTAVFSYFWEIINFVWKYARETSHKHYAMLPN